MQQFLAKAISRLDRIGHMSEMIEAHGMEPRRAKLLQAKATRIQRKRTGNARKSKFTLPGSNVAHSLERCEFHFNSGLTSAFESYVENST